MNNLIERIRGRLRFVGAQLNAVQALIVGYLVINPGAAREVVNAIVPVEYRPIAAAIAGFAAWLVVHFASKSDAKKAVRDAS